MEERRQEGVRPTQAAHCSIDDCLEPVDSKGFCSKHYFRDYYQRNRARRLAESAVYRQANAEKLKTQKKSYYQANKDRHRVWSTRWKAAHRERHLELMRNWGVLNRERARMSEATREAQKKVGGFRVSTRDLVNTIRRQDGRCAYCGTPFATGSAKREWDHVIPLSKGGRHSIGNLVAACHACNASKGASYVTEWRAQVVRLTPPPDATE